MDNIVSSLVNIFFAYQLGYIPRGYRKVLTRWCPGTAPIALRAVMKSMMQPAFRIERHSARGCSFTEVFRLDGALWWPITFRPPFWKKQLFFDALENGVPVALEAIGIDVFWAGKAIAEFDPFFVGRIVESTEPEMRTMAERAGQNLIVVDDEHLYIRGGEPMYIAPRDIQITPDLLFAEVVNSGIAFGSALPLDPLSPADDGVLTAPDIRVAVIEGRAFGISRVANCHPTFVRTFEHHSTNFDPIDFQIRACLRELSIRIERALNRAKLPKEILQSATVFGDIRQHVNHSASECATVLRAFISWYRDLPLKHGYRFRSEYDLVRRCIASVEHRCRSEDASSPFDKSQLDPADEEALSLLAHEPRGS
jgi:hypothetical protein